MLIFFKVLLKSQSSKIRIFSPTIIQSFITNKICLSIGLWIIEALLYIELIYCYQNLPLWLLFIDVSTQKSVQVTENAGQAPSLIQVISSGSFFYDASSGWYNTLGIQDWDWACTIQDWAYQCLEDNFLQLLGPFQTFSSQGSKYSVCYCINITDVWVSSQITQFISFLIPHFQW